MSEDFLRYISTPVLWNVLEGCMVCAGGYMLAFLEQSGTGRWSLRVAF